jgi:hypothetical protein
MPKLYYVQQSDKANFAKILPNLRVKYQQNKAI